MEKVWDELKKIEAQAQQIQTDAQDKAKKLTQQAKQDAEKLIDNSKIYADEESQKLHQRVIEEANNTREAQLKDNEGTTKKLKAQAKKHIDKAVSKIVDSVLEEN
jgi:vacuolar-type H+-ATPase subunit H